MSEYSITQDQIDTLLNEVSIEDRVQNQFGKIKNKISRMLRNYTSSELLQIKKNLGQYMKRLDDKGPYSLEFIESFKSDYKNFSKEVLQRSQDYSLFELVIKLENLIGAMFYKVEEERRRYPRFPLTSDLLLDIADKTHTLFGIDISSVGISFYAPVELEVGRRYTLSTPAPHNEQLLADVLRIVPVESEKLNIWRTAAVFQNLMSWEHIRDIIIKTMGSEF